MWHFLKLTKKMIEIRKIIHPGKSIHDWSLFKIKLHTEEKKNALCWLNLQTVCVCVFVCLPVCGHQGWWKRRKLCHWGSTQRDQQWPTRILRLSESWHRRRELWAVTPVFQLLFQAESCFLPFFLSADERWIDYYLFILNLETLKCIWMFSPNKHRWWLRYITELFFFFLR